MLHRGDLIPHFTLRTIGGHPFSYSSVWQHRNLVLVFVGAAADAGLDVDRILSHPAPFDAAEAELVVTADVVEGLPRRGVVIADRWGEIVHLAAAEGGGSLPSTDELVDWAAFTAMRCPECEGETR